MPKSDQKLKKSTKKKNSEISPLEHKFSESRFSDNKFFEKLFVLRKIILVWAVISIILYIGLHYHIDKKIVGVVLVIFAYVTSAFSGLLILLGAVPFLGPILLKVLALPVFWLINGIGYFASIVAIKKGHGKEVVTYRILTIVFLIGVIAGFILARYVDPF